MKLYNRNFCQTAAALAVAIFATSAATAGTPYSATLLEESSSSPLWDPGRVDSHAPIGVMGDHTHEQGEFMLSYRYMYMPMEQNYKGDSSISDSRVIAPDGEGFMVTPTRMDMEMHMFGAMYAPLDRLTLMLMAPYTLNSMDHLRRDGKRFTTDSEGWGDISLTGLVKVYDAKRQRVHLNIGVSAPTGSIDEKGFVPGPGVTQLPYPMQLGSGTWDFKPGITYLGQAQQLSWGAQLMGYIPIDDNDNGYSKGNSITATGWVARQLNDWSSASLRVTGASWENYDGVDSELKIPAGAVPTADPDRRGGSRVDLGVGLNIKLPLDGHRLSIEAALPVYQDLDGPQLGAEWILTAGWQFAF
jgi:hypothetical protein